MVPVSTMMAVFASFAPVLTAPTAQNLGVLLRGAVLAPGARTVTGCLLAAWPWVTKHWSAYADVLRRTRLPMRRLFLLTGDGSYGTHDLADAFNPASRSPSLRRVTPVSRFKMNAALYARPPAYSGRGRPRVKGHKLRSPGEVAAKRRTRWSRITVDWYGARRKEVRVCSGTGLWYRRSSRPTEVRWVVVRDPAGRRADEVFFTTDVAMSPHETVETFVRRWGIETIFQEG